MKSSKFERYLEAHNRWFFLDISLLLLGPIFIILPLIMNFHSDVYVFKAGFSILLLSFVAHRVSFNMYSRAEEDLQVEIEKLTVEIKNMAEDLSL